MISLLLAAVLTISVGQVLFCWIIWRYRWYHSIVRTSITVCALVSSFGGIWFLIRSLTGLDGTLGLATLYAVPQAIALCLILASRLYEIFSESNSQMSEVSTQLKNIQEDDEDRFSENELEKHEVRERLNEADYVRKVELDAAAKMLHAELKEIKRLLEER